MTTHLLERAIAMSKELPDDRQDDMARLMLVYAGADCDDGLSELSVEDEAAALRSRQAAARGHFATDEEMHAIRTKHGGRGSATPGSRRPSWARSSTTSRSGRRAAQARSWLG